jgi:hypothetical protein
MNGPNTLDSNIVEDGDLGFVGFASRPDPLTLQPGVAQRAENKRFVRGRAETRRGIKRLATDINIDQVPLTLPFVLTDPAPVVRSSYDGGLFAAGLFKAPVWDAGEERIAMAGTDALWLWREGQATTKVPYPGNEVIARTDRVEVFQAQDRFYVLREAEMVGTFARKTVGAGNLTRSSTTGTLVATAHGLTTGDRIAIEGADQAGWNHQFEVTVTDANTVTFTVDHAPVSPATGAGLTWRRVKAPLYWDGVASTLLKSVGGSHPTGATYRRMPSAGIGCYFNNSVVVAPAPARDVVLLSDVLEPDTFDEMLKSFRANAGSADYLVAVHPYAEGQLLLFMRNSIYRARILIDPTGTTISEDSFIELLTDEVGCAARDSVVTAGQFVYFLSDAGVYRLESNFADLKLRGMTMPLSDPIADQFDLVNWQQAHLSNAVWFDNRYWLAVPVGDAEYPNRIVVFNSLNEAWESVDDYPAELNTLVVSGYGRRRRLFGVSRAGLLFLLDENADGDDPTSLTVTERIPIPGRLVTRRYIYGNSLPKRILRSIVSVILEPGSAVETRVRMFDPDAELVLGNTANPGSEAEDYVQKLSVRRTGASAEVEIADVSGRSTVRTVVLEAVIPHDRRTTRTTN